jgi:enterochelin esterase-like enzyme
MIVVMTNGYYWQAHAPDVPMTPPADILSRAPRFTMGGMPSDPGSRDGSTLKPFTESVAADVIPYVDIAFRTLANRENRAVAGLSMGGGQAIYLGLRRLDQFASVGGFSPAVINWPNSLKPRQQGEVAWTLNGEEVSGLFPELGAKDNGRIKLLYISCGLDDFMLKPDRDFKDWLRAKGITFTEMEQPGYAHEWAFWRLSLIDFVPRLFQ